MSNRSIAVAVVTAALLGASSSASFAATLVADYQFQNTLASSVAGAPPLTEATSGDTYSTDTVDGQSRTVYNFSGNDGLYLQTNGLISPASYSIVMYAELQPLAGPGEAKLIDFKNLVEDSGLYNDGGELDFYNVPTALGGSITSALLPEYVQIAFTRDAATDPANPVVTAYVGGAKAFSFVDTGSTVPPYNANLALIEDPTPTADQFLHFFMNDNATILGTETLVREENAGSVARLRLYDGALTGDEVAALDTVPEPASLALLAIGSLALLRRRSRG